MATLSEVLHRARVEYGGSMDELADQIGISVPHIYKATNPDGEQSFPVQRLVPFMRETGDTRPLAHLADRMGFLLVPIKKLRVPKSRKAAGKLRDDLQHSANSLMTQLRELEECEDLPAQREKAEAFISAATAHAGLTIAMRELVRREPQLDLDFGD